DLLGHHPVQLGRVTQLAEVGPAQVLLVEVEDRPLDWPLEATGLLLLHGVQLVQTLDEKQVGHLLDDLHGVGDAAAPERTPDVVDLGLDGASDHGAPLPSPTAASRHQAAPSHSRFSGCRFALDLRASWSSMN